MGEGEAEQGSNWLFGSARGILNGREWRDELISLLLLLSLPTHWGQVIVNHQGENMSTSLLERTVLYGRSLYISEMVGQRVLIHVFQFSPVENICAFFTTERIRIVTLSSEIEERRVCHADLYVPPHHIY